MSKARMRSRTAGLIAVTLAAGALLSWTLIARIGWGQQNASAPAGDAQAIEQAQSLSRAFRAAAKHVLPTVVEVRTTVKPSESSIDRQFRSENPFEGTPFEDFFGDDLPGFDFRRIPRVPRPGLGSGVIIDASGIVLTNNHVVADADEVTVQLGDGREFDVKDVKTDERTDLAVLRLDTNQRLPAARLGDSDQLEIGDWVLAIGNPFELEQTVSAGIISGKGRSLGAVRRARFLQTDAAINPGNSGGPLVNLNGEVVGINTAIFSRTGGSQGVGFAIPVNLAKWVTPQLIKQGRVARAYLGVSIVDVDAELAEQLDVPLNGGVMIEHVSDGSPAEESGLREKDVIVTFDGRKIRTTADLQELVERSAADSRHELKILRDGKSQTVGLVLKAMPEDFETSMLESRLRDDRAISSEFYHDEQLGLMVKNLTKAFAEQLGYEGLSGALIVDVEHDRIAAEAGLREGMLITRVGDRPVKNVGDYRAAMKEESLEGGIALEVQ